MGGVLACYSYISPLLTGRAGIPAAAVPLVLAGFGIGALIGTNTGGRLGDRRPIATALTAAAATALVLLAMALVPGNTVAAVILVALMGLTGFTVNPVVSSLAVRFAGNAPTLGAALTVSAFNAGIAAGTVVAGVALTSPLGLSGPALTGAAITALTVVPLLALTRPRWSPSPPGRPGPISNDGGHADRQAQRSRARLMPCPERRGTAHEKQTHEQGGQQCVEL